MKHTRLSAFRAPSPAALVAFAALAAAPPARADIRPRQVAVLVNTNVPESEQVAARYLRLRGVPDDNVIRLPMGHTRPADRRSVDRKYYLERIAGPVAAWLKEHRAVTTLVTTYGVPYAVQAMKDVPESDAAVDSELAACLFPQPVDPVRWVPNPLFVRGVNPLGLRDPRQRDLVFVARLDGPTAEIAERLVEDAVAVEKDGLKGGAFVDTRGIESSSGYGIGDLILRGSHDLLAGAGFPATLDEAGESWKAGPSGRSAIAEGAAYYAGWYDLENFQDIFGEKGLARGAIAWHLASGEAIDLWSPKSKDWCPNLLKRGAAVTWGPVREPYVHAFPHADVLVEMLLEGAPIAEAYWLSLPHVSWAMVLLGDPLYRPFAVPRPALVAGPYRPAGRDGEGVLPGKKGSLSVGLRAVGPPGSRLPAMTGKVRGGRWVKAPAAEFSIGRLGAGETVCIAIPDVEVERPAGSLFRLALDVGGGDSRRLVVLEGRTGMSRMLRRRAWSEVLAVDPRGSMVFGGPQGAPFLVRLRDFSEKKFDLLPGHRLLAADFSPDSRYLAFRLGRPGVGGKVEMGSGLLDLEGDNEVEIPGDFYFARWISASTALLCGTDRIPAPNGKLIRFDARTRRKTPIPVPDGWTGQPAGTTNVLLLIGPNGEIGYRREGGETVEVLRGKGPFISWAGADDLSCFAGLDREKKLWVQLAGEEAPRAVGEAPGGKVDWSLFSTRFAWPDADGKGHIHVCPAKKTFDLGPFASGIWSPDEARFLYVTGDRQRAELRQWTEAGTRPLLPAEGLGMYWLLRDAFTADGKSLFLLAGPDLDLNVWEIYLPR